MVTNDERVQRYAWAIYDDQIDSFDPDEVDEVVSAVMAVADAELAELRHTLDGLRDLRVEDYAKLDQAYDRTHAAEDALRAERAKVARVEALVRRTELLDGNPMDSWVGTRDLLAALNGPPELEYPDLAYAVQKGGPNLDGPTTLTDEPTGDAMRWTKDDK